VKSFLDLVKGRLLVMRVSLLLGLVAELP